MSEENVENKSARPVIFELRAMSDDPRAIGIVLLKNLIMVGRSINCDLCINLDIVSNIHAVVEVKNGNGVIHDMNSTNGVMINGEKIAKVGNFKLGDTISFGGAQYTFAVYNEDASGEYSLDILSPEQSKVLFPGRFENEDPAEVLNQDPDSFPLIVTDEKGEENVLDDGLETETPPQKLPDVPAPPPKPRYVGYPLAKDPKAEFNEYIFEDMDNVYPVFHYPKTTCVEIIILYKDDLISVDYVDEKSGDFYLKGYSPKDNEVEYPPLGKNNKQHLIATEGTDVLVYPIDGYNVLFLQDHETKILDSESASSDEPINLGPTGIVRLHKHDLQIFVRRVESPPDVKPAPFFTRDMVFLKKFLAPALCAILFVFLLVSLVDIKEEEKKEKNIKRLAKILHRPVKKVQTRMSVSNQKKKVESTKAKDTPKKVNKKVMTQKKKKRLKKKRPKLAKKGRKKTKKKSKSVKKPVKTFKLSSSLKSLLAKSKAASKAEVKAAAKKVDYGSGGTFSGKNVSDNLVRAKVSSKVGSLENIASGKIDKSTSAKGLAIKGSTVVADIPIKTIVGSAIDPQIVLQLLREHLPQFRHCYQKELEGTASNRFEGVVKLGFRIGATGNVVKTDVTSKSRSKQHPMHQCISRVLKGIQFPSPKGGGVVDINQSINFNIAN